ncbi:MAG: Ig-like domain-containing protein [Archangiaceae bacterium]|nr:Ig-like domain-containing protein [Archangiaceae bacterium]
MGGWRTGVLAGCVMVLGCEGSIGDPLTLEITAPAASCAKGRKLRLTALSRFDAQTAGVTADVSWASSNPSVGAVSNEAGKKGVVDCASEGTTRISAALGGATASMDLSVTAAELDALVAGAGAADPLPLGTSRPLTAVGTYSDGTSRDVTADVSWSSSEPGIIAISGDTARAMSMGASRVAMSVGDVSGSVMISTSAALLTGLTAAVQPATLPRGAVGQLQAVGTFTDGVTRTVATAQWSSSDEQVARVETQGVVAVAPGVARLTVSAQGFTAAADVTVTAAQLVTLELSPRQADLAAGESLRFTLSGTFTDGTQRDLSAAAQWSSSLPSVLLADPAQVAGLFWGVGPGTATVTAAVFGQSVTQPVTVIPARLVEVTLTPVDPSLPKLSTRQLTATGVYSDDTRVDLTAQVAWSSTDPTVVSVDASGLATALTQGSCFVRAAWQGKNPSTHVTVVSAALVGLDVTPHAASVAKGRAQAFTVTAQFADGTSRDFTSQVLWSSSAPAVAILSNGPSSFGVASTFAPGNATITASVGALSATAALAVGPAVLDEVQLTAPASTLARGTKVRVQATAVYSDATTLDVTEQATWSASAPAVASVSTQAGSRGEVTGNAEGSSTLTASYAGKVPAFTVTVTAAQLLSIGVSPSNASMPRGTQRAFTAVGVYTDGSSQDLTAQVTWSASSAAVLASNAPGTQGQVTALAEGSAQVRAASGSVVGQTSVQVTAAELVSLQLTPTSATLPAGTTVQLLLRGTYTDAAVVDLNASAVWSSSAPNVTVSSAGLVRAVTAGPSATVTADFGGKSATATITAVAARLDRITLAPLNASMAQATTRQFSAIGSYSDGSFVDLTADVLWSSSDGQVAGVSNASGSRGLASAFGAGTVTIGAVKDGVSASTPLTVVPGTVVRIDVIAGSTSAAKGTLKQLFAQATLSDGSTQDVTSQATWSSSDPTVATVSNGSGSRGLVTAVAVGVSTLTATVGSTSGTVVLTVTPAGLVSMTLTPQNATLATGSTVQLAAYGTYTDGATVDVTAQALWSSSNAAIADVSNAQGSFGLVSGFADGAVTVSATLAGKSAGTTVTVFTP